MKITIRTLLLISAFISSLEVYARGNDVDTTQNKSIVFRFLADNDAFFIPYQGNGDKLTALYATVDRYKHLITAGTVTINVAGYSSFYSGAKENLRSAAIRANRVKSELIIHNGIREEHFATTVHASSYDGRKSGVVVTLYIPQIEAKQEVPEKEPKLEPVAKEPPKPEAAKDIPKPESVIVPVQEKPVTEQTETVSAKQLSSVTPEDPTGFYLRTNLLYDAILLPTIGAEWRINPGIGIKLDGSFSYWSGNTGNTQKMWIVSPEVRRYIGGNKRFYLGLGANVGQYNICGYPLGNLFSGDTGYQGKLFGGGLTAGYRLMLIRGLYLDFNLGLGYTYLEYDSFTITDGVRVYKGKDQTNNFWGPTQAGVSLVWRLTK